MTEAFRGEALDWRLEDEVVEVELFRPPCNELGTVALSELEALESFVNTGAGGARALIFYSSLERGFCAGADLRELYEGLLRQGRASSTQEALRGFVERVHRVFDSLDQAGLATVAAIHGFCFGGGLELALTCDLRIADRSARFCFPELRLGLIPGFGGLPRLTREVGNAMARDLLLTGRSLNAERAHAVGLVSQVVARGEALAAARRTAAHLRKFDPEVVRAAKSFVKPLPSEALAKEKALFLELLGEPRVEEALRVFVARKDARPYVP